MLSYGHMIVKRIVIIVVCLSSMCFIVCPVLSGCSQMQSQNGDLEPPKRFEPKKIERILYLCSETSFSKLDGIMTGMARRCEIYGIDLAVIDCKDKDSVFALAVDELDTMNVDAVMVTAKNEKLGPILEEKCNQLSVPLLSIESRLLNSEGQGICCADINMYQCGELAGKRLGAKAKSMLCNGRKKSVVILSLSNSSSAVQAVFGFRDGLYKVLPELSNESYTIIEVLDASTEKQLLAITNKMGKPDENTDYIMFAFNDEGGYALFKYITEKKIDPESVLFAGVGGGKYAYEIFSSHNAAAASYYTVYVDTEVLGESAVTLLFDSIADNMTLKSTLLFDGELIGIDNYSTKLAYPDCDSK